MKNKDLFLRATDTLNGSLDVLSIANVKRSDLAHLIIYLRGQAAGIKLGDDKIVHWDVYKTAELTAYTIELHRAVLLLGKEVNRIRVGQKQVIKNFIKEAQRSDEMIEIQKQRKEVDDAYKRTKT